MSTKTAKNPKAGKSSKKSKSAKVTSKKRDENTGLELRLAFAQAGITVLTHDLYKFVDSMPRKSTKAEIINNILTFVSLYKV